MGCNRALLISGPTACFLDTLSVSSPQAKPCEAADVSLLTMCQSNVLMFSVCVFNVFELRQGFDDQSHDQSPSQPQIIRHVCTQA